MSGQSGQVESWWGSEWVGSFVRMAPGRECPGGPVVRAQPFHCRGHGFKPCLGSYDSECHQGSRQTTGREDGRCEEGENHVEPGRLSPSLHGVVKILLDLGIFGFKRQPSHVNLYIWSSSTHAHQVGSRTIPLPHWPSMSFAKKRGGSPGPSLTLNLKE